MGPDDVELVLFDLGGVLVRLGGVGAMRDLAGIDSDDEVWARWLACPWVRSFERGLCSMDDFASGVISDWGLSIAPSEFLERFASWPEALFEGAVELVEEVRSRVPVGCLSNTNSIHWEVQGNVWGFDQLFDFRFLSHELGLIKPDLEIFEHVVRAAGSPGAGIVFLDDNSLNVASALEMGLQAHQVRGVEEARATLAALGLISPGKR